MTSDGDVGIERIREARRAVDVFLCALERGESNSPEEIIAAHPQLAPELAAEFAKLQRIEAARQVAQETLHQPLGQISFRVLCPHCGAPSEATVQDSFHETRCSSCGRVFSLITETEVQPAARIGRFELLEKLGVGGFGTVWKAWDTELQRFVALKIPRRANLDEVDQEQFRREARAVAQLRHPHVIPIHEVGQEDGTIYIVSEYIRGSTLANVLKQRRLNPRDAAQLCATVADALDHAHQAGIIHRDLKPSNIIIDDTGQPYVTDFGLAKRNSGEITMTVQGQILGTPAYLSPEQARGDAYKADAQSDVYTLGVVLYELLTGRLPFGGQLGTLLHQIITEEPLAPRSLDKSIPLDLETICLKAMSKEPGLRYPTAGQMAEDLRCFLRGLPIQARRISLAERVWRWVRRKPSLAGVIGLSGVLALVVFSIFASSYADFRSARQRVVLATEPLGANVVFIPLDPRTGAFRPRDKIEAGTSPVKQWLLPGDYLVVVYTDADNFHEVFRHVPDFEEESAWAPAYKHRRWRKQQRLFELPTIKVWNQATSTRGMAFVKGGGFVMGSNALRGEAPPHRRRVPDYYLGATEVTIGHYRREDARWKPDASCMPIALPDNHALRCISYDQATAFAESTGTRLPDEAEYEFVASRGDKSASDASDAAVGEWPFGPVGEPQSDRVVLDNGNVLYGLYSNVAEWTSSWFTPYPVEAEQLPVPEAPDSLRVVRGGTQSVAQGEPDRSDWQRGPRYRLGLPRNTWLPGLGFRCARSSKPRLEEVDFGAVVLTDGQ